MAFIKNTDTLVEGALQKFFTEQRAKDAVQPELSQLDSAISAEEVARQSADSAIEGRLSTLEGSGEGSVAKAEQDAKDYADQKVADLVNSAPAVLDTLKELSDALGGDENFAVTVSNQIGAVDGKVDQEISDRQAAVSAEQGRAQAAEEALDGRLDIIEGSGEGSVAKAEQDAKDYTDEKIGDLEGQPDVATYVGQLSSSVFGAISAEQSRAEGAEGALSGRLDALEADPVTKAYVDGEVSTLEGSISAEQSARELADSALEGRLDSLEADPTTKSYVDSQVSAEQSRAEGAESALDGRLDALEADPTTKTYVDGQISSEQSARQSADSALSGRLDALEADPVTKTYVDGEVSDLQGQITQEISDRQGAVSAEQSAREAADQALDGRLDILESDPTTKTYVDGEVSDLQGQINQEISNRQSAVSGEQSRAEAAEAALDGRLDSLEADPVTKSYVDGEVLDLQGQIDNVLSNVDGAALDSLTEIVAAFQAADSSLNGAISSLSSELDGRIDVLEADPTTKTYVDGQISSESSARAAAISAEQSRAEGAEAALDGRLDALEADPVTKTYVDAHASAEESAREALESALDARLDALEADPVTKSYVDGELAEKVDVTANYDIKPAMYQGGSKSANFQINWANGPFQEFTLGASCTVTFANPVTGGSYMLKLVQDGTGSRQITWPASVEWANGEAPTMSGASKVDFIQMVYDGSSYYGNYQLEDVTFAKSSELDGEVAALEAMVEAEEAARQAEDLTFFKLDGSRAMTGGLKVKHAEKSASYTLTSSDYIVGVTSVAGGKTMTLPSASAEGAGKMFMIKDQSGSASESNYIRVAAPSGQTLDGQSYYDIKVPYESVSVVSNGSHWFII